MILFFKLIGIAFKSQMQHRASFLMLMLSYFLATFVDIIGIWILFDRFELIQGWTVKEVAVLYGTISMGFSIAESTARGFDNLGIPIKNGDFDRFLLRPIGTLSQVAAREVQPLRLGRFFQGLVVLLWGATALDFGLISYQSLVIAFSIVGTASLFYGLMILQGTICFWTLESLELMNITTFGAMETGQYPMSIYNLWFRMFFTFLIPLACVVYYPIATALLHETFPLWTAFLFPLAGVSFLWLSCRFWHYGVTHYHSTGN